MNKTLPYLVSNVIEVRFNFIAMENYFSLFSSFCAYTFYRPFRFDITRHSAKGNDNGCGENDGKQL